MNQLKIVLWSLVLSRNRYGVANKMVARDFTEAGFNYFRLKLGLICNGNLYYCVHIYFHKRYSTGVHVLTMDEGCSHWCLEKRILAGVNSGTIYFSKM